MNEWMNEWIGDKGREDAAKTHLWCSVPKFSLIGTYCRSAGRQTAELMLFWRTFEILGLLCSPLRLLRAKLDTRRSKLTVCASKPNFTTCDLLLVSHLVVCLSHTVCLFLIWRHVAVHLRPTPLGCPPLMQPVVSQQWRICNTLTLAAIAWLNTFVLRHRNCDWAGITWFKRVLQCHYLIKD